MRTDHGGEPAARIDASVNVNPFGPPPSLDIVFARARELSSRYPEIDAARAREAWARRLEVPHSEVAVGNGASELISLVLRAWQPRRVHVFEPTYSEYDAAARSAGAAIESHALQVAGTEWCTPLTTADPAPGDAIVVCQPNNPTGHLTDPELLRAFAHANPETLLLVDESFLGFHADADALTLARPATPANVAVVRSLTKLYCVPGLRVGVLYAAADITFRIASIRDPWSVNAIAAEAAIALAAEDAETDPQSYLGRTRSWLAEGGPRAAENLAAQGLLVCDSVAPFHLCRLPEGVELAAIATPLADAGIALRDASTFPGLGPGWVRVAVRTPAENAEVAAAIGAALKAIS